MASYRYIAYDIQKSLKKNFDDADVLLPQIVYWIQVVANALRHRDYLETSSTSYLSTWSSIPVLADPSNGRPYIELPKNIMDFPFDEGIQYITYNYDTGCCCAGPNWAQVTFSPTTPKDAWRLFQDEYEKPTSKNPYFYRVTMVNGVSVNRVYFLGIDCVKISDVEIGLLTTLDATDVCDLDDDVPVPDEKIPDLIQQVLQLGRFVSFMPEERVNSGGDEAKATVNNVPNINPEQAQQPQQ